MQILEIQSKFQKIWVCKKLGKRRGWFSPNTDNFLAFFIVFEWGRILEGAVDKKEVKCNAKLRRNWISVNVFVLAVVFRRQFSKAFTEIQLRRNFALQFTSYLSIALSKILPHSKIIKNAKKLSVFGENNSRCLSNFLQAHIFWNFDHISRIYN